MIWWPQVPRSWFGESACKQRPQEEPSPVLRCPRGFSGTPAKYGKTPAQVGGGLFTGVCFPKLLFRRAYRQRRHSTARDREGILRSQACAVGSLSNLQVAGVETHHRAAEVPGTASSAGDSQSCVSARITAEGHKNRDALAIHGILRATKGAVTPFTAVVMSV